MKKNIIAFGASNSRESINKQFAIYAANQLTNTDVETLDLNDFEMPIYGIDYETENGIPELAHIFKEKIKNVDGIVISFAEHNGAYSTAFKNIFDWISRIEQDVWYNKPMFLLGTSPGGRGASTILEIAVNKLSRMTEGKVVDFSLPSFHQNFHSENGITEVDLASSFQLKLEAFSATL